MTYPFRTCLDPEDNPVNWFFSCAFLTADSSLGLACSVDHSMLRRKPTRLELKLDDIEEFESIRKDLEARNLKSASLVPNQAISTIFPPEALEENPSLTLSASGGHWDSLISGRMAPISVSVITLLSPVVL
nr:anaphase-promoting complex subunit CDC26 isoform X1 [Vulpes vulpes]